MKKLTKSEIDFLNFIEFRLAPDMRQSACDSLANAAREANDWDYEAPTPDAVECSTADDLDRLVAIARKLSGIAGDSEGW